MRSTALRFAFSIFVTFLAHCAHAQRAATPRHVEKIDHPPEEVFGDFRSLAWADAFDAMHRTLALEYPFTAWRGIDWPVLRDRFRPKILESEKNQDAALFYLTVREYVQSIPDGHMDISPKKFGRFGNETYGAFGFEAARLDDGRVIAHSVHASGSAEKSGMTPGAEILSVGQRPTAHYLRELSTLWAGPVIATHAAREQEQIDLLSRTSIGATAVFEFKNPGDPSTRQSTLTATDDRGKGRSILRLARFVPNPEEKFVRHRVLPSGVGYIALFAETPEMVDEFKKSLAELVTAKVSGLILDLRRNGGGEDNAAAAICGSFVRERRLYQCCQYRNPATGTFDIADSETIHVEPQEPHFDGPLIALIGRRTISNGEGIAYQLARVPNARTLGFDATAGSFGEAGGVIKLPHGIEINFPYGACVDENGRVLIDSDSRGVGGVEPQIKVPRTYENMLKIGGGIDVELLAAESEILRQATAR